MYAFIWKKFSLVNMCLECSAMAEQLLQCPLLLLTIIGTIFLECQPCNFTLEFRTTVVCEIGLKLTQMSSFDIIQGSHHLYLLLSLLWLLCWAMKRLFHSLTVSPMSQGSFSLMIHLYIKTAGLLSFLLADRSHHIVVFK